METLHRTLIGALLIGITIFAPTCSSQKLPAATRVWSVGPLWTSEPVMGISFGPNGATMTGPHTDSQTRSTFSATRSVVFAGDRIILAAQTGTRRIEGAQLPAEVYRVISLDAKSGNTKDSREFLAFGSLILFATNDGHVIVSGRRIERLTPDLKTDAVLEFSEHGGAENVSPDGSVLGEETRPGFALVNTQTLKAMTLTTEPEVATSISSKGFVTDNIHWTRDYPKDLSFITLFDGSGEHLVFHGKCAGRPQFLNDELILNVGCREGQILDIKGNVVRNFPWRGSVAFAGVSQNGKRFALQYSKSGSGDSDAVKQECFVVYSLGSGDPITEVVPDVLPEAQSWTAFSPDGTLFVVGSPLKLTLYRLP
jgi:hypothetical protein